MSAGINPRCFTCPLPDCNQESRDCPIRDERLARSRASKARVAERNRIYQRTYQRQRRAAAKEAS